MVQVNDIINNVIKVINIHPNIGNKKAFLCECLLCGNIKAIRAQVLTDKNKPIKSCGCITNPDLINQKFNKLLVLSRSSKHNVVSKAKYWLCQCDCGNTAIVDSHSLIYGKTKSCGCYMIEKNSIHNMSDSIEYKRWWNMIRRCSDPYIDGYSNYGGRGIIVCDRWKEFKNFYNDIGPIPDNTYSIERVDVNGNYEPSNCIWLPVNKQQRNQRNTVLNENIVVSIRSDFHNGMSLSQLSSKYTMTTVGNIWHVIHNKTWV